MPHAIPTSQSAKVNELQDHGHVNVKPQCVHVMKLLYKRLLKQIYNEKQHQNTKEVECI